MSIYAKSCESCVVPDEIYESDTFGFYINPVHRLIDLWSIMPCYAPEVVLYMTPSF